MQSQSGSRDKGHKKKKRILKAKAQNSELMQSKNQNQATLENRLCNIRITRESERILCKVVREIGNS